MRMTSWLSFGHLLLRFLGAMAISKGIFFLSIHKIYTMLEEFQPRRVHPGVFVEMPARFFAVGCLLTVMPGQQFALLLGLNREPGDRQGDQAPDADLLSRFDAEAVAFIADPLKGGIDFLDDLQ